MVKLSDALDISDEDFEYFQQKVLSLSGIHLTKQKKDLVRSRLLARLGQHGLDHLQEYRAFLAGLPADHEEWLEFINQITTNKTEFFREPSHFKLLTEQFLPAWLQRHPATDAKLRVWSAACSTGEEAYSLAMVLARFFKSPGRFEILASDIDTAVLGYAINGVYPLAKLSEIPVEYQYQSVVKGSGEVAGWFKIARNVRQSIRFERINLVDHEFRYNFPFDIIFCRNVFLYFQPECIDRICTKFASVLESDGILVLGHSESLATKDSLWRSARDSVYRKVSADKPQLAKAVDRTVTAKPAPSRHKVLIVDDSATMRQMLSNCLAKSPLLTVAGVVGDPRDLSAAIRKHRPDVITLDLKMPHMSGCEVLERVLCDYTIPTLIISAVTMEEGPEVMRALELGAVDYMEKPTFETLKNGAAGLIDRVLQAASTKVRRGQKRTLSPRRATSPKRSGTYQYRKPLILVGASTGGVQAITEILTQLPPSIPPILIVQHIPALFSLAFATRLNQICPFNVREAQHGEAVQHDQVLIAPGNKHMTIEADGLGGLKVALSDQPPVNRHRPSVDVLFESAIKIGLGPQVIGVILTGMGNDGAAGLKLLKQHGAQTIAQDEASCAVFGMPREAIRLGAADTVCSLETIAKQIERLLAAKDGASAA